MIVADFAYVEVGRLRVCHEKAADAGGWQHGQALGQAHADVFALQELEHIGFDAVVRAGRVAGRGANAFVFFADHLFVAQGFVGRVAPHIRPRALVQALGKGFGQAVGQGFQHDAGVVVQIVLEGFFFLLRTQTGRHREQADVIMPPRMPIVLILRVDMTIFANSRRIYCLECFVINSNFGGDKVRQTAAGAHHAIDHLLLGLLAQAVPGHRHLGAGLVGVDFDVIVVDRVGRVKRQHTIGLQPAAFDQAFQHAFAVGQDAHGLGADDFVLQNRGVRAGQVPGLEKRAPVDVISQLHQVEIFKDTAADEFGLGRGVNIPINRCFVGARMGEEPQRHLLFVRVLGPHFVVVGVQLGNVGGGLLAEQALRHTHAAGRIGHINDRPFVMRRNFDGGVDAGTGRTTDQ